MPFELVLGLRLRQWGTLPYPGGYLDQPLAVIRPIEEMADTHWAFKDRMAAKSRKGGSAKWAKDNPITAQFCLDVDEWREQMEDEQ